MRMCIRLLPALLLPLFVFFHIGNCEDIRVLIKKETRVSLYTSKDGYYEYSAQDIKSPVVVHGPIVYIDNMPYRGSVQVRPYKNRLLVINMLDVDDYIKGVLYNEISPFWPMEAIKAQAVVARTYALYIISRSKNVPGRFYDLDATDNSQVYTGRNAERYRLSKAVDETKSIIIKCNGKILPAFYHACCGGKTEQASELWNINLPCLASVDCPFCKGSPHYTWMFKISQSEVAKKLRPKLGIGFNEYIISIKPVSYTVSGRVKKLKVMTDIGNEYYILGKEFRMTLGAKNIRSANFTAKLKNGVFVFTGKGWGHGVGMCQWGAYGMAKKGHDFKEILRYYYPSCEIVTTESK